jgi:prolyl-tRNA editing enzyme YbaK/EbsC (Cys-tRNA(Pro) deacylase)
VSRPCSSRWLTSSATTPPIGLGDAVPALVDAAVLELETVLAGGGSPELLIELSPQRMVELSAATVGSFRKGPHPNT